MGKKLKTIKNATTAQMLVRCPDGLKERIFRALGKEMARSGSRVSINEFLLRLLEGGLQRLGE